MKKLIISLFTIASFFSLMSQDYENAIKLRHTWLLTNPIKQVALQYERGISDNISVYANVGYIIPRNFIKDGNFPNRVRDIFGIPDGQDVAKFDWDGREITMNDLKFTGFGAGLGARFYPQAEAIKRFYIGAKGSYTTAGLTKMTGVNQLEHNYDGTMKLNSINLALELGNQYIIADRVSIDWTILSFGTSLLNSKSGYTNEDPDRNHTADAADVEQWFIDDFPIGEPNRTITVNDNGLDVAFKMAFPYFRTGVTVGFVF